MLKKGFLTVLLVAISIFAFSLAQADQIDGLASGGAGANFVGPTPPDGLDLYVNPGALGDALIYGYYNARGSWDFIRVINTSTSDGIAAKVRFREGGDSNEVLDFAICLSAGDQWSGWVLGDINPDNPAVLYWYDDDTPTYPDPQGDNDATNNYLATVALKYSGTGAAPCVTADDTKEGYFEIIGATAWADTPGIRLIETPAECAEAAGITPGALLGTLDVPNTLAGNTYIFDLTEPGIGTYAYNATALAYFRELPISISLASDSSPRLDDSTDVNANGTGIDEVNYVLTKAREYAIYDIEAGFEADTTIINTFPTKRLSILLITNNGPFNDPAYIDTDGSIADDDYRCELVDVRLWDDAENTPTTTIGFSPGETEVLEKCDEVNLIVVGAAATAVLDSNLVQFTLAAPSGFELGWISEDFTTIAGRSTTVNYRTTYGLPVISYELQGLIEAYYTHMLPLRYNTSVGTSTTTE